MADNSHTKKNIIIETDEFLTPKADEQDAVEEESLSELNQAEEKESPEQLKMQLEEVTQKAAEEHDRLLRLSAEFENYKKRMNRQMDDFRKYANETLLKDLLAVVDNLERALTTSGEKNDDSMKSCLIEGVEMTLNEILKILSKSNVTPVTALGKPFDPAFHEAVMQETSNELPENTVINEFQKGYLIHDRLLRPAMVVVSKGKSEQ